MFVWECGGVELWGCGFVVDQSQVVGRKDLSLSGQNTKKFNFSLWQKFKIGSRIIYHPI